MRNRYLKEPSIYEVLLWVCLLMFFFWSLIWGLKYIVLGVLWLVDLI
jgi:hypothetical protein